MNGPVERPLRSLHVITSTARRGAETFAVQLAAALRAMGDEARVVALVSGQGSEVHSVPSLGVSRRSLGTLTGLRRAAAGVDVVVAHGSSTLEACVTALLGVRVPLVYRTIGDPSYWIRDGVRRRMIARMLRRATRHVVLWQGAADQLHAEYDVPVERIDVIPNAVAADSFGSPRVDDRRHARRELGIGSDQYVLAFVGALSREKNVGSAIDALASLEGAVLVVAGDGPLRSSLETQAGHVAPGRVRFLGLVASPAAVYTAADLLVLPSRTEGMPGVIIEAGLVGTPTVATPVGSVPEMIEDDVTGFLLARDDPGSLADRIRAALPVAPDVGGRAREVFHRRYTMDRIAPLWCATIRRTCQG